MRNSCRTIFFVSIFILFSNRVFSQWTSSLQLEGVSVLTVASHGTTLYAGTSAGVYWSTDNGLEWNLLPGSPTNVCAFAFGDSSVFAGSTDAAVGVMRSTDSGTSWVPVNKGCQKGVTCLAMCGAVLLRGNSGFYDPPYLNCSTDNGDNWTGSVGLSNSVFALGYRKRELYAGTRWTGVSRSLDSGRTWTNPSWFCGLPGNPVGLEPVSAFATVDTIIFAAVSSLGVFRSLDGISWEGARSGIGSGRVNTFAVGGNRLFAGTSGGGVYLSANQGLTWIPVNAGLGNLDVRSLAVQGDFLFAGTATGLWMRPLPEMIQNQDLREVFPLHVGWAARYSYVYHYNWNNSSNHTSGASVDSGTVQCELFGAPYVLDSLRVWTVREVDHILHLERTFNSGALVSEESWWNDSTFIFPLKEHLAGLHEIEVRGRVWNFPRVGIPGVSRVYHYNYDSVYSLGVPGAFEICSFDEHRGMFARDYHDTRMANPPVDSIITIRMLGTPTGIDAEPEVAGRTGFELLGNYPNPFNPVTVIKYTVGGTRGQGSGAREAGTRDSGLGTGEAGTRSQEPGTRKTRLVVYDLLGREVATLVDEVKAPGSYEVRFDGSGLASGMYIYRLTAGGYVQARTMALVK